MDSSARGFTNIFDFMNISYLYFIKNQSAELPGIYGSMSYSALAPMSFSPGGT